MREPFDAATGVHNFSDAVNVLSNNKEDSKIAAISFLKQHRTLQQSMIAFISDTVNEINKIVSDDPGRYTDLRNEQSIKWIKQVSKIDISLPII